MRVGNTRRCLRGAIARANARLHKLRLDRLQQEYADLVTESRIFVRWPEDITRIVRPAILISGG